MRWFQACLERIATSSLLRRRFPLSPSVATRRRAMRGSGAGLCGGGSPGGCGSGAAAAGQPWSLPQPCLTQALGFKVGGWLQQGFAVNSDHPASGFNGPVATNDLDREYMLNQLWLYLDRPANNGGSGFAWGGHLDMLYGTDWRFGINRGLEDRINGFNFQTYGMVIPQMYLEFAYNKLSVKVGHQAAILDYEVIPAPFNPLYSHSYSYGYTVPQLVTGVIADYKLTDQFSMQGGFHRGWFMFEDNNERPGFHRRREMEADRQPGVRGLRRIDRSSGSGRRAGPVRLEPGDPTATAAGPAVRAGAQPGI